VLELSGLAVMLVALGFAWAIFLGYPDGLSHRTALDFVGILVFTFAVLTFHSRVVKLQPAACALLCVFTWAIPFLVFGLTFGTAGLRFGDVSVFLTFSILLAALTTEAYIVSWRRPRKRY
jgi:hypothetical protein